MSGTAGQKQAPSNWVVPLAKAWGNQYRLGKQCTHARDSSRIFGAMPAARSWMQDQMTAAATSEAYGLKPTRRLKGLGLS